MNYLFACYELGNLDDDVHGFLHVLDRHELIAAVEVQATGKDIGTRQALERELGAVRTSANGFYTRLYTYRLHGGKSGVDDMHHRFNLLAHIIVLVAKFQSSGTRTVFFIDFCHKTFHLLLALFEAGAVVVTDNVIPIR